jgi:Uma2 family endonuclease
MSAAVQYPQRHAVTASEFLRMGAAGVFAPEARLELIEGEIVEMAPIGSLHAGTVADLTRLLVRLVGDAAIVWTQNPLLLDERSMPQPDLALLRPRVDRYKRSHPAPGDVLLLIEVSDTTLRFDVAAKMPLYARCGVAEAWVIDLNEQAIRVFREPGPGGYAASQVVTGTQTVECVALPQVCIAAHQVF